MEKVNWEAVLKGVISWEWYHERLCTSDVRPFKWLENFHCSVNFLTLFGTNLLIVILYFFQAIQTSW